MCMILNAKLHWIDFFGMKSELILGYNSSNLTLFLAL